MIHLLLKSGSMIILRSKLGKKRRLGATRLGIGVPPGRFFSPVPPAGPKNAGNSAGGCQWLELLLGENVVESPAYAFVHLHYRIFTVCRMSETLGKATLWSAYNQLANGSLPRVKFRCSAKKSKGRRKQRCHVTKGLTCKQNKLIFRLAY